MCSLVHIGKENTGLLTLKRNHLALKPTRKLGGVAIYVKNDYHVVHRNDLEVLGVECVWVEIKISKNHLVLIGTFYRPPDSLNYTFDLIEHSIDLAVDTGINTIVVLGDFNEEQLKLQNNKMSNIFVKYNMIQFINEPTHFTENSSSCIDLISSTDPNVIDLIHVGQPFLNVNVLYMVYLKSLKHCIHVLRDEYGYMIVETIINIVKNCSVSTGMNLLILEIA